MTSASLVLRKLTTLLDHTSRVERRRPDALDAFRSDLDRQDALAMSLLVALQEAADICLHIAADEGWGIASSYAEGFALVARHDVIPMALADRLSAIAALRNRVAHGYGSVDFERLWREAPDGVEALRAFAAAVGRFLGREVLPDADPHAD
jgi:uncharacterized protein YutE (UPF0331/DUF86 family)